MQAATGGTVTTLATNKTIVRQLTGQRVRVVAGVNVPMLWRTLCYGTKEPVDALVERAIAGATQGVMPVTASPPQNQALRATTHDQTGHDDQ